MDTFGRGNKCREQNWKHLLTCYGFCDLFTSDSQKRLILGLNGSHEAVRPRLGWAAAGISGLITSLKSQIK